MNLLLFEWLTNLIIFCISLIIPVFFKKLNKTEMKKTTSLETTDR